MGFETQRSTAGATAPNLSPRLAQSLAADGTTSSHMSSVPAGRRDSTFVSRAGIGAATQRCRLVVGARRLAHERPQAQENLFSQGSPLNRSFGVTLWGDAHDASRADDAQEERPGRVVLGEQDLQKEVVLRKTSAQTKQTNEGAQKRLLLARHDGEEIAPASGAPPP